MGSKHHIEIIGLIKEPGFHVAKSIAEELKEKFPGNFLAPKIQPLLELDWHTFLCNKKTELRGETWQYPSGFMCFCNGDLLGNEKDLASWAQSQWDFTFTLPERADTALAHNCYLKHLKSTGHQFVFMEIETAGEKVGRLLFELFTDVCPKTSKNFEALCTGERGLSPDGYPLWYKGSLFHRVVPNGWLQGGDIAPGSRGNGGASIYGETFEDENFAVFHTKRGTLGMANKGPHSNGSQFYITLQPAAWMDRSYVAFGQLVEGVDILKRLEEVPTCYERPTVDFRVLNCGVFQL